jgi:pimeloyl-ACP methyl ester carboxylesterase
MRDAMVSPGDARMRWIETPGDEPTRVYVHGLGATAAAYFAGVAARPELAGHRSLFIDLLGFGLSDRPAEFGYTLLDHADALARALDAAGVSAADVVAHSMGGAVAIVLADRRPDLVARLVLIEANLDPMPPPAAGSVTIVSYDETAFRAGGFAETLDRVGPVWAATMRLADPVGLHRTAVSLVRGTTPTMRTLLEALPMPRTFLVGGRSGALAGRDSLVNAGVEVVTIADAGHNVMLDAPAEFALATAAGLSAQPLPGRRVPPRLGVVEPPHHRSQP